MDRSTIAENNHLQRRLRRYRKHQHMHNHQTHPRAEHSRGGGRHRARRGAVLGAVVSLLDERPMHGYELMTELENRSAGKWRPSAGAIYPALKKMTESGLIESRDVDGKRQFSLTDNGRKHLATIRASREDGEGEPWEQTATGGRGELRSVIAELHGQARQIGRFGSADQIERARLVFTDAKQQLYAILADGDLQGRTVDEDRTDPSAAPAAPTTAPPDDT